MQIGLKSDNQVIQETADAGILILKKTKECITFPHLIIHIYYAKAVMKQNCEELDICQWVTFWILIENPSADFSSDD